MKFTWKRGILATIAMAALLAIALYVAPFFFPWSGLNCTHQEIDTNTGRIRITEYRLFMKTSERIEDSPISELFVGNSETAVEPDWHRVNTFSPGVRHSPHYIYHSAFHQMRMLQMIWLDAESSGLAELEKFKKATALHLLALWQFDRSDWLAGDYLSNFQDLLIDDDKAAGFAAVSQIKMPLYEIKDHQLTATLFFPSGQPLEQVEGYKNSAGVFIRHGVSKQWTADGSLDGIDQYVHGRRD